MKNKILAISIIFILLSFVLINNSVFAASYPDVTTISGIDYRYKDYLVHTAFDNTIMLIMASDDYYVLNSSKFTWATNGAFFIKAIGGTVHAYIYYLHNGVWTDPSYKAVADGDYLYHSLYPLDQANFNLLESSKDVYYENSDEIFFQAPVQELTLAQVLAVSNPTKSFQTMMSGIIPYLIALVVGLVAFWKAWQLLLKELRKA